MIWATAFLLLNPYQGKSFFQFFAVFFQRLLLLMSGQLSRGDLVSDEIQIFVLTAIAASCAFLGAFLVLRRMAMLANALSHTILLGVLAAYFAASFFSSDFQIGGVHLPSMTLLLSAALVTGLLTTLITEVLSKTVGLQEDASIGLVFTSLFALGIILVTIWTRNMHLGLEVVMGNADALHLDDLDWSLLLLVCNLFLVIIFYKEYLVTTFDPALAKALGISPIFFNYFLMGQVSASTIAAFRSVGVILVLAFLVGPCLIARFFTHRLNRLLVMSSGIAVLTAICGVALTRHVLTVYGIALSTGATIVSLLFVVFLFACFLYPLRMKN